MVVSDMFYFHLYLGKIPILTNIFQMGWNHQPGIFDISLSQDREWLSAAAPPVLQGSPLRELETSLKKVPFFPTKSFRYLKWRDMEGFLNLSSRLFWGWENFPDVGHIHTASIGEDPFILGAWIVWWSFKKIHFTNLKKKVGTSPPKHLFPPFFCSFFCSWVIGFFVQWNHRMIGFFNQPFMNQDPYIYPTSSPLKS